MTSKSEYNINSLNLFMLSLILIKVLDLYMFDVLD